MKKRWIQTWKALRENRGSGIVLVMIAMLFVTILGATLLYTSYTGYLVKLTDRGGKENFYQASTMMDQVVAGLQETASDAIAGAYSEVLADYSNLTDPEAAFSDAFRERMLPRNSDMPLYKLSDGTYLYNVSKLFSYAETPVDAQMTLNGYSGEGDSTASPGRVKISADGTTITLKSVSLTYLQNGFETNVTTDICIDMPEFYQYNGEYAVSGLPNYALIAKKELIAKGATLAGNAYAGKVTIPSGTLKLDKKTTVISGGVVSLTQGTAKLEQESETSLWATDLALGAQTSATLRGSSYLKDDLELRSRSTAELEGNYYGFGYEPDNPDANSAILANGRGAVLNLQNARLLSLAGNSFVRATASGNSLLMGDSVAAKSEQRLYLVPDRYLNKNDLLTSNPVVIKVSSGQEPDLTQFTATLPTEVKTKYGASVVKLVYPLGTETVEKQFVVYLFLKFDTVDHANAYFKDAFSKNPKDIQEYLTGYLDVQGRASALKSRGYVLTDDVLAGGDGEKFATRTSDRLARFYQNLCVSLTTNKTSADAKDPYAYYVLEDKVRFLGAPVWGALSDGKKWYVTGGDYTVDSDAAPTLIIAAGNVVVKHDYQGLILCGGTITVQSDATVSSGESVDALLLAVQDYLVNYGSNSTPDDDVPEKKTWGLDELVYYRNWSKQ